MYCVEYLRKLTRRLEDAGVDAPAFTAALLFEKVFSVSRQDQRNPDTQLDQDSPKIQTQMKELEGLIRRREEGYPIQYLLGEWEFYGLPFWVGEGVLIPRSDTEVVVEQALRLLEGRAYPQVLDLCSGSGCIAISIAHECPDARAVGVELSPEAFDFLKRNISRNGVEDRVLPVLGDGLDPTVVEGKFDLIVSNPPYIRPKQMLSLQREVLFEPRMALEASEEGLYFYREIARCWRKRLVPGGALLFEIGFDQAREVGQIMEEAGFSAIKWTQDYGGQDRALWGIVSG